MADDVLVIYRAETAEINAKTKQVADNILGVGKAAVKAGDETTKSFIKSEKSAKNASLTVRNLGQGLSGLVGIAASLSSAFGININVLRDLHNVGSVLIHSSRELHHVLHLGKAAHVANAAGATVNTAATAATAAATEGATVATKSLSKAIFTSPLFIIGAIVAAAAGAYALFRDNVFDVAKALDTLNSKFKNNIEGIEVSEKFSKLFSDAEIERLKLNEVSIEDLQKAKVESLKRELSNLAELKEATRQHTFELIELSSQASEEEKKKIQEEIDANTKKGTDIVLQETKLLVDLDTLDVEFASLKKKRKEKEEAEAKKDADKKKKEAEDEAKRRKDEEAKRLESLKKQFDTQQDEDDKFFREVTKRAEDKFKSEARLENERFWAEQDRIEMSLIKKEEKNKAFEVLEKEHQKNLKDILQKAEEERLKIEADAVEKRLQAQKKADDERLALFQDGLKKAISKEERRLAEEKKAKDERIDDIKKVTDSVIEAANEQLKASQERIEKQISLEEQAIETQRSLAERGLANSLAVEEKRKAALERSLVAEKEKQRKLKLFETFINSVAEFSKTETTTFGAVAKALAVVAGAEAASAIFAEEGGIIGGSGLLQSNGRTHRGGGDVLLHAQTGEGILSRNRMDALGGSRGFNNLVESLDHNTDWRLPSNALILPMERKNNELLSEIKSLNKKIGKIPRFHTAIDGLGNIVEIAERAGKRTVKTYKKRTI